LLSGWNAKCQFNHRTFHPLSGLRIQTSVPSAQRRSLRMFNVTANLLLSVLSSTQPHSTSPYMHFTSLWTFNSPNPRRCYLFFLSSALPDRSVLSPPRLLLRKGPPRARFSEGRFQQSPTTQIQATRNLHPLSNDVCQRRQVT
jgi:hypothetical protein